MGLYIFVLLLQKTGMCIHVNFAEAVDWSLTTHKYTLRKAKTSERRWVVEPQEEE